MSIGKRFCVRILKKTLKTIGFISFLSPLGGIQKSRTAKKPYFSFEKSIKMKKLIITEIRAKI